MNAAKTEKRKNIKTGRLAQHYLCAACKGEYPAKEVSVDHIEPVVDPKIGWVSWDVFIERLFCAADNLQCLCIKCHKTKTKLEREYASLHKMQRTKDTRTDV